MRIHITIVCVAFIIGACSLMPEIKKNVDQAIIGKPVQNAVDVLGLPTHDSTIVGLHLIVWKNRGCTLTAEIQDGIVNKYELIDSDQENISCYGWLRHVR